MRHLNILLAMKIMSGCFCLTLSRWWTDQGVKLLHYYKQGTRLTNDCMFKDFVVEKLDMFYDQLYGEIKEPLKALQERYEKIKNGNYKHVKMWVVWEQELAKALEALKYRNMSEEALTYHQKTIKEILCMARDV